MVRIYRKNGWKLNDSDNIVNNIIRMIENNNGECPCHNEVEDKRCPCADYRFNEICHCKLYVKERTEKA